MIKIDKGSAPDLFHKSGKIAKAGHQLARQFKNKKRIGRLSFDMSVLIPVKTILLDIFKNKCGYCESRVGLTSSVQVDSFRPKNGARGLTKNEYAPDHYWWLVYDWNNLVISCTLCNQKYKRSYFPLEREELRCKIGTVGNGELKKEKPLLIDPCFDNPQEHLEFDETGIVKELSKKGKVTIELLGLNRKELVKSRRSTIHQLKNKLEIIEFTKDFRNKFTTEFLTYIQDLYSEHPSQEYVAAQRTAFDNWYEENSSLWENIKKIHKDQSVTRRKEIPEKSHFASTKKEIREVEQILTTIKRFTIKKIEIENFKSISKLALNVKPASDKDKDKDGGESWLLLLGDNGIGKSSILQAITLALCSKKQLTKLKLDVTDFLKRGKKTGSVKIYSYEHDEPIILHFDKKGFKSELKEAPTFILAYGSTRLLPKGSITPDMHKEPYFNIRNLFDYSVALDDPNRWISNLNRTNDFKKRVAPAFFDLLALRGKDKIWIKNGIINIKQFGEDHELEDNSDGYKTIAALVTDIMKSLSSDKANYHNSYGIVLIDEIGNHLHPRWRMKIVGALRKAFPKLQFIVTTHEPLCLRGLSQGEVAVMVRDKRHVIRALEGDILPDHNLLQIDQLLTSDLFGLINVLDEDTEKTYEEYYKLLSKKEKEKSPADKNRINELTSKLKNKEQLGDNPREEVFYKLIDQVYASKIRGQGFKTNETLKKDTIDEVKSIIKEKKYEWL